MSLEGIQLATATIAAYTRLPDATARSTHWIKSIKLKYQFRDIYFKFMAKEIANGIFIFA